MAKIKEQECEKWQQMTGRLETVLEKIPTYRILSILRYSEFCQFRVE
jgi:hypothetical protein